MSTNNTTQASGGGIGCLSVLGIVFITLKLTHNIDWSWAWVLAPFWVPVAIVAAIFAAIGGMALVAAVGRGR